MSRHIRWPVLLCLLPLCACVTKLFDKDYAPPADSAVARVVFLSLDRGSYTVDVLQDEKWKPTRWHASEHRAAGGASFFNEMSQADGEILAGEQVALRLNFQAPANDDEPELSCTPEVRICGMADTRYELLLRAVKGQCEVILRKQYVSDTGVLRRDTLDLKKAARCPAPAPAPTTERKP
ncbi:hypothetical protein [Solimonas sp. K1W22B-7]|uniref:hypothetical protein n=1 Tax=Solimonas sp. K1W22B-7 TaxID=2303331 RepID=UPI0013C44FA2|nr:hypothetical protein [Solimonas sp. K1W22B-7]